MKILNREEMQQADRHTIEHVGIPGYALMECAAQAMLEETEKYIADTFGLEREKAGPGIIKPSVTVLCGSGNNGGDGLVLARRLEVRGIKTSSWLGSLTLYPIRISPEALQQAYFFVKF